MGKIVDMKGNDIAPADDKAAETSQLCLGFIPDDADVLLCECDGHSFVVTRFKGEIAYYCTECHRLVEV